MGEGRGAGSTECDGLVFASPGLVESRRGVIVTLKLGAPCDRYQEFSLQGEEREGGREVRQMTGERRGLLSVVEEKDG
jgi:hypothetical protein